MANAITSSSASAESDQLTQEVQQNQLENLEKQAKNAMIEQDFQTAKAAIQSSTQ